MTKFRHLPVAGRIIIVAVAIGVFAIAVVACATSYNAIYRLVGQLGLYGYRINQLFPLMLDAAFLVAELAAILGGIMRAVTRSDEVSVGWPGTTMLLCGLGTIGFNVAHAYLIGGRGDPLTVWRCVVASLPPVLMILSFQVLIAIVKWVMLHLGRPLQQRRRPHPHRCPATAWPRRRPVRAVPAPSGLWAGAQLGAFASQPQRPPGSGRRRGAGRGDQAPPGRGVPRPARPRTARPPDHAGAAGGGPGGHRHLERPGLGGVRAVCAADLGGLDRRPAGERHPTQGPPPSGGERLMTGSDPLGPSRRCPRAGRCEACGATRALDVATYQTPVGVFCATVCDPCVDTRNAPPVRSWVEAVERVWAHCGHLGIDVDQMAALLGAEGEEPPW